MYGEEALDLKSRAKNEKRKQIRRKGRGKRRTEKKEKKVRKYWGKNAQEKKKLVEKCQK